MSARAIGSSCPSRTARIRRSAAMRRTGRPERAARKVTLTPRARRARESDVPTLPAPMMKTRSSGAFTVDPMLVDVRKHFARHESFDLFGVSGANRVANGGARYFGQERLGSARRREPPAPEHEQGR